jgi:Zn-dependent peptidase ImmA (M78 family)
LFQNPYAHLDDIGGYSALKNQSVIQQPSSVTPLEIVSLQEINPKQKEFYSDEEIEKFVRRLQTKLWQERSKIWPDIAINNPIKVLNPEVALAAIGYNFELAETLGQFYHEGKQVEVAGTIDRDTKHVRISGQFSPFIRSFTAAHELGHAVLHKANGLHRDRPVDGSTLSRNAVELQADKFATYFLMPQKQVGKVFKQLFLADTFLLSEETAFALGSDYEALKNKTLRQMSRMLVSAERFNGKNFTSLADQFGVSVEAMAIRLEELKLIEE